MKAGITRRFQISDGLLLVAATGLGLGGCRLRLSLTGDARSPRTLGISECAILLSCWTMALLFLRIEANRTRRRRLWGEPGFLACITVAFAYAWNTVNVVLLYAATLMKLTPAQLSKVTFLEVARTVIARILTPDFGQGADVGGGILLVWLLTWASGRCRPVPSWIDWAGRVLGCAWIARSRS